MHYETRCDADTNDKDEGVLDISELDGLFTAIVSGPATIMPSQWLPAVWGDFEPMWEDEKEVQEILSLMMRHMNAIANMLMETPEECEPVYSELRVGRNDPCRCGSGKKYKKCCLH